MGVEFILLLPGPAGKPSVGQHGGVRLSLAGYEDTQDTAQWPCSVAPKSSYTRTLSGKWGPVIWECSSKYLVKEKQKSCSSHLEVLDATLKFYFYLFVIMHNRKKRYFESRTGASKSLVTDYFIMLI